MMSKNVQVPWEFFVDVFKLVELLEYVPLPDDVQNIKKAVRESLDAKLDALERRKLYSASKMADTDQEREDARQKYLDKAGIQPEFRWGTKGVE